MESEFQQHNFNLYDHHRRRNSATLTRYQSAPSSYFSSFGESIEEFLDRPTSPETERILSGFIETTVDTFLHRGFTGESEKKSMEVKTEEDLDSTATAEMDVAVVENPRSIGYVPIKRRREKDDRNIPETAATASNLTRHNSSPAGMFSSIDVETAYAAVMKNIGGFGGSNLTNTINKTEPSTSEIDVKPCFSTRLPPRTHSGGFNRGNASSSKLTSIARTQSGGLDQYKTKEEDSSSKRPPLSHHMSLPKSLSDIEQLLSDSIPCKLRAKRGCATHPRSIAERVRRTKISERMRKLQDLVPNMDTQTNTSDMLDLAVQYIKDLQEQVKALEENRARCRCSSK
ncbi:unnamed protein product [Cochlearia groenlandica]